MSITTKSVEGVVAAGLCTSCGTCVAICPKTAVSMAETPGGLLYARVDIGACIACGLCLRACGGAQLAPGLLSDTIDPFKGEVLAAYCGYAADPAIRMRGQSGGVVTALLTFMLESGRADQALVNRMPEDGTLRPQPFWAHDKEELLASQGSKYCPVALNSAIPREIGKNGKKLAVVGLPCHLHSLRNVQQFNAQWKTGVEITIGLFCDRTLAYGAIDYLIDKGGTARNDVAAFRFRDKTQGGWPGTILIRRKDGKEVRVLSQERQRVKDYFTPPRCRICFDKMNVLSDVAVGDAWGVKEEAAGFSVLLARTAMGAALLVEAKKAGYLCLDDVDQEKLFKGQGVEIRRLQWSAFTKAWRSTNEAIPDYRISSKFVEKNTDKIEDFVKGQTLWSIVYSSGKTSKQIIRSVKVRQFVATIKRKLKM